VETEEELNKVSSILVETAWEAPSIDIARKKRTEISGLVGMELNIKAKAGASTAKKVVADELDSYESLVREAGY